MEKKIVWIASNFKTFCAFFWILTSYHVKAQVEPPTIMPGLAATYSTKLEVTGINARLYYAADHHYCFGPEVSFFKKDTEEGELSLFEANANLHYILDLKKGLGVYPLGGFNYTTETETKDLNETEEKHTENAFGLNIGAGMHYASGRILFFGEYKYVVSELDDHFISVGALINFSLAKKEKEIPH
ncbi:outer membrane beta-barrel protein [Spongiivirga citrea]|uniref:Outer membrane beta-barrel protein n=1 Tax=Spongiivirga citrea TaxID=1481457 RepID=A0A6M0CE23_9FLAO|nr:outer membrane beta-barrel protein [Spongiivirga citrea]NER16088.1 outer membrane beta-barrel protein [Spongiivirga citrea]